MSDHSRSPGTASVRREIGATMAALSALMFLTVLYNDISTIVGPSAGDLPWMLIGRYVVAMIAGGAIAGFALMGMFGREGVAGWVLAMSGGFGATLLAGFLGSIAGLLPDRLADGFQAADLFAVAAGGLILPLAIHDWPWLLVLLPSVISATHLRARSKRRALVTVVG